MLLITKVPIKIRLSWGQPYGAIPNISQNGYVKVLMAGEYKDTDLFIARHPVDLLSKQHRFTYDLWHSRKRIGDYTSLKKAKEAAIAFLSNEI